MSMTDTGDDAMAGQGVTPQGGGAPAGGGQAGPPPMQGSPILAALARRGAGPQTSAPGMGNMAQSLMQIKTACDMLQTALPGLPAGGQQHKDVLKALQSLTRHLPQGQPTAGVQQTQLGDMLRMTIRNALMQKLMGQGQGPGAGGQQQGGAPPAPQPSTPLPGA